MAYLAKYDNKYFKKKYKKYRQWEVKAGYHIVNMLSLDSILDMGCGVGSYLEGSILAGCDDICGIELNYHIAKRYIVKSISSHIKYGDVTKKLNLNREFDCVISFEVAEHIDPLGTDYFIKNLIKYSSKYILFTAAPKGQPGRGHINLRKRSFWIKAIEAKGVVYKKDMVKKFREEWKLLGVPYYILRNLIIFKKSISNGK